VRTILTCACAFILTLSGSGKAAEQTVLKPLGDWICRASGYYTFNVDLAGHSNPTAEPLNASQSQVKISVQQETHNDFPLSDNLGAKLRIEIRGSLESLFDTFTGSGANYLKQES
jgi:hypothetical protein